MGRPGEQTNDRVEQQRRRRALAGARRPRPCGAAGRGPILSHPCHPPTHAILFSSLGAHLQGLVSRGLGPDGDAVLLGPHVDHDAANLLAVVKLRPQGRCKGLRLEGCKVVRRGAGAVQGGQPRGPAAAAVPCAAAPAAALQHCASSPGAATACGPGSTSMAAPARPGSPSAPRPDPSAARTCSPMLPSTPCSHMVSSSWRLALGTIAVHLPAQHAVGGAQRGSGGGWSGGTRRRRAGSRQTCSKQGGSGSGGGSASTAMQHMHAVGPGAHRRARSAGPPTWAQCPPGTGAGRSRGSGGRAG